MASVTGETVYLPGGEGGRSVDLLLLGTLSTMVSSLGSGFFTTGWAGFGAESRTTRGLGLGAALVASAGVFAGLTRCVAGETGLATVLRFLCWALPRVNPSSPCRTASTSRTVEISSSFRAFAACDHKGRRQKTKPVNGI